MSNISSSLTCCSQIPGLLSVLMAEDFTSQCPTNSLHNKRKERKTDWSRFSNLYAFSKPNDRRALDLMNAAAVEVMKDLTDLCVAYGVSDEYSFVFHPSCQLFERRHGFVTHFCFSFAFCLCGLVLTKEWQKTGDDGGVDVHGSLHPSMEYVFPRYAVEEPGSAVL